MAQPPLFLDTAYIHALFNSRDQWHSKAVEWQKMLEIDNRRLVTTQLILVEIGNGLSSRQFRQKAASIIRNLQEDPIVDVIPVTPAAFSLALVVVMRDIGLSDALTTDDHFRQAGFNALLLG